MEAVSYISSAGLRVLLRLFKKASKEGKEFAVAGAAGMVKKILIDSNMNSYLTMHQSLDEL
jgi:anti-anti-sigma factor